MNIAGFDITSTFCHIQATLIIIFVTQGTRSHVPAQVHLHLYMYLSVAEHYCLWICPVIILSRKYVTANIKFNCKTGMLWGTYQVSDFFPSLSLCLSSSLLSFCFHTNQLCKRQIRRMECYVIKKGIVNYHLADFKYGIISKEI